MDADHGRLEIRRYTVCPVKDYLTADLIERWPGLKTIVYSGVIDPLIPVH